MRIYLIVLLLAAALTAPLLYFAGWASDVRGCRTLPGKGAYLAYCTNPEFGDYEHAAFVWDLEPDAVRAMRQASILIIGDSRTQFGFSTTATNRFFAGIDAKYYLLGFGYGEISAFHDFLFRKYRLAPKVLVVNADPFFRPGMSTAGEEVLQRPVYGLFLALMKKGFNTIQPALCRLPRFCSQTSASTWRDSGNGQWLWHGVLYPADQTTLLIAPLKLNPLPLSSLPLWTEYAEAFLSRSRTPRDCIIFTGVPTPQLDAEGIALALARQTGVQAVIPRLPGLYSVDASHLSSASAERWSAAFLAEAKPIIERCLAR